MEYIGTIALDIDGTITDDRRLVPEAVMAYLKSLYEKKWQIVFITGREFVYAMQALSALEFPYLLATQNGADLISMPEKKHLKSFYFSRQVAVDLEHLFDAIGQDFLLYSGFERGDFCYYRPGKGSEKTKELMSWMQQRSAVSWVEIEDFSQCLPSHFPMIKAIGHERDFLEIEPRILKNHSLNYVTIKDPKTNFFDYLLITDYRASKKGALEYLEHHHSIKRPLIVAGDDHNDRDSLEYADISIVMENAPNALRLKGDIIAPLSIHHGIIEGIEKALEKI